MTPLTPEEARDQLATADALATSSGKAARYGAILMAVVGMLAGAVTFAFPVFASISPVISAIGATVYLVWLGALLSWQYRCARVEGRRWSLHYGAAFGLTMVLYAIGVAWSISSSPSLAIWAPYCVLVALPMLFAASRMARR